MLMTVYWENARMNIEIVNFVGYVNAESQAFRIKYAEYLKENGLQED